MKKRRNVRPNPERIGKHEEIKLEATMREEIRRATEEMFNECGGRELTAAIKAALLTVEVFNIEMGELKRQLEAGKRSDVELSKLTVSPSQGVRAAVVLSKLSKEWRELMDVCTEQVHRAMEQMMDAPAAAAPAPKCADVSANCSPAAVASRPEVASAISA